MATNLDPIDKVEQRFVEAFAHPKERIALAPYEADIKWLIEQATEYALNGKTTPTQRAPEVTDDQLRFLDRDFDDVGLATLREVWPQVRAWLVAAKGSTTPKPTPTGQRPSSEEKR